MFSRFHNSRALKSVTQVAVTAGVAIAGIAGVRCSPSAPTRAPVAALRVCADPNNLPFSNARGEGFENHIAELVAGELHRRVEYTWWAQRRGFVRNTLKADKCDLIVGVPNHYALTATTQPYYRSTYVFVARNGPNADVRSLDDPRLHTAKIGVQLIGDDFANTPPAHALSRRGIIDNVRGYTVYGDYRQPNPPARIVDAVANGDVDIAIVWGPLAGYFATREPVPLHIVPVSPQQDLPALPFTFDISMGVRRTDTVLKKRLDSILTNRREAVDSILREYGVPRVDATHAVAMVNEP